jgi:hypothetical protein
MERKGVRSDGKEEKEGNNKKSMKVFTKGKFCFINMISYTCMHIYPQSNINVFLPMDSLSEKSENQS